MIQTMWECISCKCPQSWEGGGGEKVGRNWAKTSEGVKCCLWSGVSVLCSSMFSASFDFLPVHLDQHTFCNGDRNMLK